MKRLIHAIAALISWHDDKKISLYKRAAQVLFVPSTFDVACEKSMRGVPGYESRLYGAECPSPHYASLLAMYASMHRFGYEKERGNTVRPGQAYVGATLRSYAGYIKRAIQEHGVETVLDYGAGKGANYEAHEPFRLRET